MCARKKADTEKPVSSTAKKKNAEQNTAEPKIAEQTTVADLKENWADDYIQRNMPDKDKLAELLEKAKGEARNYVQFVEDCGEDVVSQSLFTRIKKKYAYTRALRTEVIEAIASHSVSPEVTIDLLMHANGYVTKEEDERGKVSIHSKKPQSYRDYTETIKSIVVMDLLKKGKQIMLLKWEDWEEKTQCSRYGLGLPKGDFSIRISGEGVKFIRYFNFTDAYEEEDGNWVIDGVAPGREKRTAERVFSEESNLFLQDIWEPEILDDIKTVFVFAKETIYDEFIKMASELKVNSRMSALLMDVANGEVLKEYDIPRKEIRS